MAAKLSLTRYLFVIFLLADEVAIVAAVLLALSLLKIAVPFEYLAAAFGGIAVLSLALFKLLAPTGTRPVLGMEALVGASGEAFTELAPDGLVRIGGELWRARSTGGFLQRGEEVVVTRTDGLRLFIERRQQTG